MDEDILDLFEKINDHILGMRDFDSVSWYQEDLDELNKMLDNLKQLLRKNN